MKTGKRIISVLLSMALMITLINVYGINAKAEETTQTEIKTYEVGKDTLPYSDEELYNQFFDINNKIDISIDMSDAEMEKLENDFQKFDAKGSKSPIYRMADVTITITLASNGETNVYYIPKTGIRMKGNTTRNSFYNTQNDTIYDLIHMKLSFAETFDKVDDGYEANEYYLTDETAPNPNNSSVWDSAERKIQKKRTFAGLGKIDVKWNGNYDNTYLREYYSYETYRSQGIMAPHMNLTSMEFGDKSTDKQYHLGVYSIHECVDDTFLARNLDETDQGGDLYKAGWADTTGYGTWNGADFTKNTTYGIADEFANDCAGTDYNYDLKTNKKTSDNSALIKMIDVLSNNVTKESFASVVDVNTFVKYAAVSYFLGNPDDLKNNKNNFYVYFYPETSQKAGQAVIIPYDFDRCLGVTLGYNPDRTGMTESSPFSKGCGTPIYDYSIVSKTGYYTDEYTQALDEVYNCSMLTTESFENVYKIAEKNYADLAAIDERLQLPDTKKPKLTGENRMSRFYFSMADDEETEDYSSTYSNITVDNYLKAIKATYDNEKKYSNIQDGYYIESALTSWRADPDYMMEYNQDDNTYSFVWKLDQEQAFCIVGSDDSIYRYNALTGIIPEGVDTNLTGSILLAPGTYKITFNDTTKKITITDPTVPSSIKITMNANGGKIGTASSKSKTVSYGAKIGTLTTPKRSGYIFNGYYTKKNGGSKIKATTKCTFKKATTVYAHWTKVNVGKIKLSYAKNSKANTIEIKYVKASGAAGYEISYATNSKYKNATVKNTTSLSAKLTKLNKNKTYYVRVRAYAKDSTGKKIYGGYVSTKVKVVK